jgi:hypothetical protein
MSTRNILGGIGRPARKADNHTAIYEPIVLENVGASTSHKLMGLHGLLQGYLYLLYLFMYPTFYKSFKNVAQFKYWEKILTNQNLIREKIKERLNSVEVCYHSVQNLLSSRLLSKDVKIKIYSSGFAAGGFSRRTIASHL